MFSCLASAGQGGLPSKMPSTDGPLGIGRKVIDCEGLLSPDAVCAFEVFTSNEEKAETSTTKECFINVDF